MPKPLYEALSKHKDNSLIYLCVTCRPQSLTIQLQARLDTIESAIAKMADSQSIGHIEFRLAELQSSLKAMKDANIELCEQVSHLVDQQKRCQDTSENIMMQFEPMKETLGKLQTDAKSWAQTAMFSSPHDNGFAQFSSQNVQEQPLPTDQFECGTVVYNIPKMINDLDAVRHLAAECNISKRDIVGARRLESKSSNPPLLVLLSDKKTKWFFLKAINSKKINGTFARPHLSPEDLDKDRELLRRLRDLR